MLYFNGFETAAPCKGKGISAQGKADRRAATPWVSPHDSGLKGIAPCKGNMSK